VDYETAIARAPNGWRHFTPADIERLPHAVRVREMGRVPRDEPPERILRALFWTLVYHLEPERWDELARCEPIHPEILQALPRAVDVALDVGAGSGRLTAHLTPRAGCVIAVEPSAGLRSLLRGNVPRAGVVGGWAEHLPVRSHISHLTTACGAFGPDPQVLAELVRVTAPGGSIVLINPEEPEWFEEHNWDRMTAQPVEALHHAAWIDDFFGPPDPPREMVAIRVR